MNSSTLTIDRCVRRGTHLVKGRTRSLDPTTTAAVTRPMRSLSLSRSSDIWSFWMSFSTISTLTVPVESLFSIWLIFLGRSNNPSVTSRRERPASFIR